MKSSTQLASEAKDYAFNPAIPLRIYLKTCVNILDKAQSAFQIGDRQMAYLFYFRYVDLCTNKLSRHPDFLTKSLDQEYLLYKQEYLQLIKLEVPAVFKIIEDLQKQIDNDYKKHQLSLARNIAKPTHHLNQINNMEENESFKTLPQNFNENRFNQSISFLNEISSPSLNKKKISHSINSSNESSGPQEQNPILLYPELPTLTFPTF
ncbi:hypothetical protein NCAS_0E01520 [Naumovozyma castellii]|uniref:Regulator of free ubiquitin chains 1 n=1 Tax=Naumovozyma castellii TaxID=27288 RepID=G0VFF6_NAUCA|nr:hypothetical protein NCAS_0E01520 [Naumovozyma castellii CBS 4309]CCC70222.1 hypothetical protein NCAS_0E01520 [Naumovozyma castellii CBS 4309]